MIGRASTGAVGQYLTEEDGNEEVDSCSASELSVGRRIGKRSESVRDMKRNYDADDLLIKHASCMSDAEIELIKGMRK